MLRPLLPLLISVVGAAALPSGSFDSAPRSPVNGRGIFGPIATDNPATTIPGGSIANSAPPVSGFFADLKGPYPTNQWWASYAAVPGNGTASGPFPYESYLGGLGLLYGVSTDRQFDGVSIKQPTQIDWLASFREHSGDWQNHKATAFDTHSVTVQYFEGDATMTMPLVPGSPYLTFEYSNATPMLTSWNGAIQQFNGQPISNGQSTTATGTEFNVTDTSGNTYLIYAFSTITLTASTAPNQGTILASSTYNDVIRMVKLNQTSHKALLDEYHQVYPSSVGLDYEFTDTTGTLYFNWNAVGGNNLLMLTWPHHRISLQNPNYPPTTSLNYLTTKGWMFPIVGTQWAMLYNLSDITWLAPRALDSSCQPTVLQNLEYEIGQLNPANAPVPGDFYYWGGTLAAQARLALIADDLGRQDLIQPVINYLEASFAWWFNSSQTVIGAYETNWGGVIDKSGASNANVDFGNGFYNDHHFHYGYFLSIAAIIAKYDNNWLNAHRDFINFFARDIINPSPADPYFTITRCRGWFEGHSWASGIANGAGSRDQESTGEAINGYYGALLWASVTLSQDYVNYAKLLVATEQQGAQVYWHLYPQYAEEDPYNPYPEADVRALITMGNVEDWQSGAWLFWGMEKSEIWAIQALPVTPINEVLYDTEWVENMWAYSMDELMDPSIDDEWKCVMIDAYSNAHPQEAAQWSANLTEWGSGQTATNELYFIGTRPNPSGQPICGSLPQNPYGNFTIQEVTSGNWVVASSSNVNLMATQSSQSGASVFNSAFIPNSGTLQLLSTLQYVTADSSGNYTLGAARTTASTWEHFQIRPKFGAAEGVYTIKAASNSLYVTINSQGGLQNNGANEADGAGFRFVSA